MSGRMVTTFDRDLMSRICWEVIEGKPLTKILEGHTHHITRRTLYDWIDRFPEAADMLNKARLISTLTMEDRGLEIVDELLERKVSKDDVAAVREGLQHMRWTMGKRNPAYAENAKPQPVMNVVFNTNALGEPDDIQAQSMTIEVPYVEVDTSGQ